MSKMNERRIIDALNEMNESRKANSSYRRLRENYIGEEDEVDVDLVDEEPVDDEVEDDVIVIVPTDDGMAHVDDALVDADTNDDPDYAVINVHQADTDLMTDVEGAIDDMDSVEPDLFDIEFVDDEDAEDDVLDIEFLPDEDEEDDDVLDIEFIDDEPEDDLAEAGVRTKFKKKVSYAGGHRHVVSAKAQKRKAKSKAKGKNYKIDPHTGKIVKKTQAEKRRDRSATTRHNLSKGSKSAARRKAVKTRKANAESFELSKSLSTNEQAFMTLVNGILEAAAAKSNGALREAKIVKVNKGRVSGNAITLECVVSDAKGNRDRANFVITGSSDNKYTVTEGADFFEGSNLTINGTYHMNGSRFVFDTMGYELKTKRGSVNEAFKVVND